MDKLTLIQILFITFCVLFFCWLISKIRNDLFVKKLNCEEYYIKIRENIKKQKSSEYLRKLIIISSSVFFMCGGPGGVVALLATVLSFFSGKDFEKPFDIYISVSIYTCSILFIIICIAFIREICINIISYSIIKKDDNLDIKKETGNPPEQ